MNRLPDFYFKADTPELMVHILEKGHEIGYIVDEFIEVGHRQAVLEAEKRLKKKYVILRTHIAKRYYIKLGKKIKVGV